MFKFFSKLSLLSAFIILGTSLAGCPGGGQPLCPTDALPAVLNTAWYQSTSTIGAFDDDIASQIGNRATLLAPARDQVPVGVGQQRRARLLTLGGRPGVGLEHRDQALDVRYLLLDRAAPHVVLEDDLVDLRRLGEEPDSIVRCLHLVNDAR